MALTSVRQVFDAMPAKFLPQQAGDMRATIQFDLSGEGGGQWYVTITDRKCAVAEGISPNPTTTMSASAADYLAVFNGALNPMAAFMQGKVKIKGDMAAILKMQKAFGVG